MDLVMEELRASGLLSSLCTITRFPEDFDAGGAPIAATAYDPVSGLVDIPCSAPPILAIDIVNASEMRMGRQVEAKDSRHVALDNYYPEIRFSDRALIDGAEYAITNVEHDSQRRYTRLAIERVTL